MYPDPNEPVPVTLEECEDLAVDEGATNGWELAARFASRMLPQIFRIDSPVFQLSLPPEHQQKLERLLADLPPEVFTASDSLGWVYQFWQAKKKKEIDDSEVKIGSRELPAVTQLFTEPYMVSFLLDNSLGAWWATRRLTEHDLKNASSEEELRRRAAIPGMPLDYLRFVRQENGAWIPAAGTFESWPDNLSQLKVLDPCCGSGHFLVAAFLMLVPMRIELEGLSAREAVNRVLSENIHGLELDQRCVELATFALALTAWKYPNAGGYRVLPELNVACSGLSISAKKEDWLALAGNNTKLLLSLEELYKQFKDAPVLGSLINPEASLGKGSLFELRWEEVEPLLTKALVGEKDDEKAEMGIVAKGLNKAARILGQKYSVTMTNVPYLAINRFSETLRIFVEKNYAKAKNDLAFVFVKRLCSLTETGGLACFVTTSGWTFQNRERHFRNEMLTSTSWKIMARLGAGAFNTISGEVVQSMLGITSNQKLKTNFYTIDVSDESGVDRKADGLRRKFTNSLNQIELQNSTHTVINFSPNSREKPLGEYAKALRGLSTGEVNWFVKYFWEIELPNNAWEYFQSDTSHTVPFGGREQVIFWESECGTIARIAEELKSLNHAIQSWRRGKPNWGKTGVAVNLMGRLYATIFTGNKYSANIGVLIPKKPEDLCALWAYCSSDDFVSSIRSFNKKISVEPRYFEKALVDFEVWRRKTSLETLPTEPYTDDPTQWIFHGHPCGSVIWDEQKKGTSNGPLRTDATVLQVAVARLLGYRWPAELDPEMELADEQHKWVERCKELLPFADQDGIVCIPPVRGEAPAADRLLNLLAASYGDAWSNDILATLLKNADHVGKTLESWLRDKFFTQHCKLFHHRPFIWHIWDGLPDGFSVLVNYHKLDRKNLETLIYTYVGDWINRQKQDIASGVDGAQERLAAAEALKKKLELILAGEAPYDIFVRWKPIEKQPIGWDPDLNDGVRLNIRPFMTVPDVQKKGAGILRDKPNIDWKKDRGNDVKSAPWYHLGPQYGGHEGDRINDHHLTLAEKRTAREAAK